ncbi:BlaI/MecI/CopY family transcriptional regulator [Lachnospiraceae bacterium ZAX-1]
MDEYKLGEMETRFADIIWENAPINSGELVRLAGDILNWKKSTTYTMLRRLVDRGIFKNDNALVSVVKTRDEFLSGQSCRYIDDTFGGSLPRFITSFVSGRKLSDKQLEEIKCLIDAYREGNAND